MVWDLKHRQELGLGGYGSFLTDDVAMDHNVPASNLRRWVGAWTTICKNATDSKLKNKERAGKATYKYGDVDKALMDRFDKLRSDGRAITPRWLVHEYKMQMVALHPDRAHHWKASPRWRTAFYKRNGICLRRKTNNHKLVYLGPNGREVKLKRYLAVLQRRVSNSCLPNAPPQSSGAYPLKKRCNIDAVPIEWACGKNMTLASKGESVVVLFTGKGDSDEKRWATLQVCLRNIAGSKIGTVDGHPWPCLMFRGVEGIAYYDGEYAPEGSNSTVDNPDMKYYHPGVIVQRQKKAWYNDRACISYITGRQGKFFKDLNEAEPGRVLMYQDNLRGQTTDQYVEASERVGIDPHYLPANMTDDVQPIDKSCGKWIKDRIGELRHVWEHGMTTDALGKVDAPRRRVLMTHWLWQAYVEFLDTGMALRMFDFCGCTMTNTGLRDGTRLSIQSVNKHVKDEAKSGRKYEFSCSAADAGPAVAGNNGRENEESIPATAEAQNEFAGTVAAGEQVTETVDVMTAAELDLRDQFDRFDPSDDDEDENPDLGPMPEDIKADWSILPKAAMTARDSLKKHDMVACNWDSGWEIGYVHEVPSTPITEASLFYVKFPTNSNYWPCYLLDGQYGDGPEDLWAKVEAKSDEAMCRSAWKKWKEVYKKGQSKKGRANKGKSKGKKAK